MQKIQTQKRSCRLNLATPFYIQQNADQDNPLKPIYLAEVLFSGKA